MEQSVNQYSTAALAYLGDSVLEVCVREMLVVRGLSSSRSLNREALEYVKASKQAEAMKNIANLLTDEENAIFHRGRNMGHTNIPKSATVSEYRNATGMEALFGYLYLLKREERIKELFNLAYDTENKGKENE